MAFLTGQTWYCGSTKWSAVTAWAATTVYAAGVLRRQLATPTVGNERVFACIVAGTSGGSEPTWTFTQGAVQPTDGTVTWIEVTGKAGVNGDTTNCTAASAVRTTAVSVGVLIYDSGTSSLQVATTAGTTAGSAPTYSATAGVTTVDGSATFTSLGLASGFAAYAAPWARLNLALASGFFVANNDTVYVSNNHAETQSTSINYNVEPGSNTNLSIICVNDAAAPPTASASTATVTTTGSGVLSILTALATIYIQGVQFISNNGIISGGNNVRLDTCVLKLTGGSNILLAGGGNPGFSNGTASNDPNGLRLTNTNIVFSTSSQTIGNTNTNTIFTMIGGSITSTGSMPTTLISCNSNFESLLANVLMRDVDLSAFTGTIINVGTDAGQQVLLQNCSLGSGVTLMAGTPTNSGRNYLSQNPIVRLHNCGNSSTTYPYQSKNILGSFTQTTSVTRGSGAASFATALGWSFTTTANASFIMPFISEEIMALNPFSSGSHTLTMFLTSAASLTNAQVWAEMEYPATAGSCLSSLVRSKAALPSLGVALTADGSSTWTGGLGNNYQIALTYSPGIAQVVKVRLYIAAPSVTIVFDPLPVMT